MTNHAEAPTAVRDRGDDPDLGIPIGRPLTRPRRVSAGLAATLAGLGIIAVAGVLAYGAYAALNAKNATAQWADFAQEVIDKSSPLRTVSDIVSTDTEVTKRLGQAQRDLASAVAEQRSPAVQQNTAELQHWDYAANVARGQFWSLTQEQAKLDRDLATVSGRLANLASSYGITLGQAEYLGQTGGLAGKQLEAQDKAWQDALRQLNALALGYKAAGSG